MKAFWFSMMPLGNMGCHITWSCKGIRLLKGTGSEVEAKPVSVCSLSFSLVRLMGSEVHFPLCYTEYPLCMCLTVYISNYLKSILNLFFSYLLIPMVLFPRMTIKILLTSKPISLQRNLNNGTQYGSFVCNSKIDKSKHLQRHMYVR